MKMRGKPLAEVLARSDSDPCEGSGTTVKMSDLVLWGAAHCPRCGDIVSVRNYKIVDHHDTGLNYKEFVTPTEATP